jgi:multidrug efflux system outer membrane protein
MRARAALAALLLASACSQLPDYRRPVAPSSGNYPTDLRPNGSAAPAAEIGWRDFFADPRLRLLIAQALETNRDLRTAVLRIEEARAQYRIQRADRVPNLDVRGSARLGDQGSGSGGSTSGADPGGNGDPTTDPSGGSDRQRTGGTGGRYRIEAAVTAFEIDFWGRVRSLSEAARARYLDSVEAQRAFRIGLVADVAEAHLTDRELAERLAVAQATVASRETSLRLARRLYERGVGSNVEVNQEAALLAQARAELAALRQSRTRNLNLLQLLVGRPIDDATLPPARPLAGQGLVRDLPAGLPSDLLVNRPDILAAEQRLIAASADVGAARAAFFPRIALTGAAGLASDDIDGLFDGGAFGWSFVPNLVQPIFDAGRNRAALDLAGVRRDIAIVDYERTIQTAFREVADALAARRDLADERAAREAERAAQAERVRLAELRFRAGEASTLESLDARRELFAAEQTLIQVRRAELAAAVTLYAALGGGLR